MLRIVLLFTTIFWALKPILVVFIATDDKDGQSRLEFVLMPHQQTSSTKTLLQLVLRSLIKFVGIFFTTLKKHFVYG